MNKAGLALAEVLGSKNVAAALLKGGGPLSLPAPKIPARKP